MINGSKVKEYPEHAGGIVYETIGELSDRTKMARSWWYNQTRKTGDGSVPRIKKGKYLLFIPSDVDEWLQRNDSVY